MPLCSKIGVYDTFTEEEINQRPNQQTEKCCHQSAYLSKLYQVFCLQETVLVT